MEKVIDKFDGVYRFLSNFYLFEIVDENGIHWDSTEHYYQAMKTLNKKEQEEIRLAPLTKTEENKKTVKYLGKSCTLRSDWDSIKIEVMKKALRMKFCFGNKMSQKLIETGDSTLIEGNYWGDTFWGVCKGVGENNLGKLLMELRKELNEKEVRLKEIF